jgi:hypothetical protein
LASRAAGKEKKSGPGEWAAREGEGRGERGKGFSFFLKFFSNSFFKLSNFTQTVNHAFES